jgi:hypothetical protein
MSARGTRLATVGALVGREASGSRWTGSRLRRQLPALLVGGLLAALALAALRVDLIRVRYALGEAMKEEQTLLDERARLIADVRELRDPSRLAELAARMGFERPERVIEAPGSAPTSPRP